MPQQYDEQTIQAKLDDAVKWILSQEEYHCPPEDGREDWEPWEFDLMDQLMRGCQSLRIPVEYVLFFDGNEVQMHSKALNEHRLDGLPVEIMTQAQLTDGAEVPPSIPAQHRRVVYALLRCARDVIGVPVARVYQEYLGETDYLFGTLLTLSRLHPDIFLDTAAQHFSKPAASVSPVFETTNLFPGFILLLTTRSPEQLAPLIERTTELDEAAGQELRAAVLDVLSDSRACDSLGWLELAQLREELERC